MAKRSNPYIEDYIQQSKVHVGLKQFNNNEGRLQKVYEKTLTLLFKGAKKSYNNNNCQNMNSSDKAQLSAKDKFKQLFIGKNGTLEHAGAVVKGQSTSTSCVCGTAPPSPAACSYCEAVLCGRCSHTCMLCGQAFCQRCAISESEGTAVCVSCYH